MAVEQCTNALAAEEQRHSKDSSELTDRLNQEKIEIQGTLTAQYISAEMTERENLEQIAASLQEIDGIESQLSQLMPRDSVRNIPPVQDSFSAADARELLARIRESGFQEQLVKRLSPGGFRSSTKMAADLYGQFDSARNYYAQAQVQEHQNCQMARSTAEVQARQKQQAAENRYRQDHTREEQLYRSRVQQLNDQLRTLRSDSRIAELKQQLNRAHQILGTDQAGWNTYTPCKTAPADLLLGVILFPCRIASPSDAVSRLLRTFPGYVPKVNGFTLPMTVPLQQPLLLYADCANPPVAGAAPLFQSIVARMIRFHPMKSFRCVFFDPVNRGTALGRLIHLTGDGPGHICQYRLSPQEIHTRMSELAGMVDEIVRELTATGCPDIYAYNSRPNSKKGIPYTAVIIHDFPNGFDSAALNNLQVLINKSAQCGISLLISHQEGVALENRAKEVENQILRRFTLMKFAANGDAKIRLGSQIYRFQPRNQDIPEAWFAEVSRRFSPRPALDNRLTKVMGSDFPKPRSAQSGLDIPFAVAENGKAAELRIGYDLCSYGFLTGGVGSGRTSLLHTLITCAVLCYPPEELELWLIDYKETEFSFYLHHCPPHVRYVAAEEASELSYSVLDEITEEIRRRKQLFISAQVQDYEGYRKSGRRDLPRILILIDEFHRMAQAAAAEPDYTVVLENIFAEAQVAGIVLLLADQQISNGLSGLSQKSRDLISVRMAMRNTEEEIRATLSVSGPTLTEQLRKQIRDTSSGVAGTVLYRYEAADSKDALHNEIRFLSCRALYATAEERAGFIDQVCKHYPNFSRQKTFFVGAKREPMNKKGVELFEQSHPPRKEEGERFYIGTPLGLQPFFWFGLRGFERGENVLFVGSDMEKSLAILQAMLLCASRNRIPAIILLPRTSRLYRAEQAFFSALTHVKILSTFPEICQFIGTQANRIRESYGNDNEPDALLPHEQRMVFLLALDELWSRMEASPLTQKQAWAEAEPEKQMPTAPKAETSSHPETDAGSADPDLSDTLSSLDRLLASLDEDGSEDAETISVLGDSGLQSSLPQTDDMVSMPGSPDLDLESPPAPPSLAGPSQEPTLDELLMSLEDDDEPVEMVIVSEQEQTVKPKQPADSPAPIIRGYNATGDLSLLISDGWKLGIHTVAALERGTALPQMRQFRMEGNFNHRIGLTMSPDEASCFLSRTRSMKALAESGDTVSAVYEHPGAREQCFRPFRFR